MAIIFLRLDGIGDFIYRVFWDEVEKEEIWVRDIELELKTKRAEDYMRSLGILK